MTNEAIEAAARAIKAELGRQFNAQPIHPDPAVDDWAATGGEINLTDAARAAAPALMEEGARLALEAMRPLAHAAASAIYGLPEMLERNALTDEEGMISEIKMALAGFRALDPAAIVKGAGHD